MDCIEELPPTFSKWLRPSLYLTSSMNLFGRNWESRVTVDIRLIWTKELPRGLFVGDAKGTILLISI